MLPFTYNHSPSDFLSTDQCLTKMAKLYSKPSEQMTEEVKTTPTPRSSRIRGSRGVTFMGIPQPLKLQSRCMGRYHIMVYFWWQLPIQRHDLFLQISTADLPLRCPSCFLFHHICTFPATTLLCSFKHNLPKWLLLRRTIWVILSTSMLKI